MEIKGREYFYVINYQSLDEELCRLEMKCIFKNLNCEKKEEKYFFSGEKISPSRSPYIKHRLAVIYKAETLKELMRCLQENNVAYDDFKFVHFKINGGELDYDEWIGSSTALGSVIDGETDMDNPNILLGVTKVYGKWIFGEYEKNDNKWKGHDKKPNTNSHSLGLKTAKALVNIAVGDNMNCTLIDPCCGVGTVVLEAVSMGVNVKAYEINCLIAEKAKENLAFFGYPDVITNGDMHQIEEHFDTAIVDIPYGLFTPITSGQQDQIIKTARRIADKLVIITFEEMEKSINSAGFEIVDFCCVTKGKFKRYISVCK